MRRAALMVLVPLAATLCCAEQGEGQQLGEQQRLPPLDVRMEGEGPVVLGGVVNGSFDALRDPEAAVVLSPCSPARLHWRATGGSGNLSYVVATAFTMYSTEGRASILGSATTIEGLPTSGSLSPDGHDWSVNVTCADNFVGIFALAVSTRSVATGEQYAPVELAWRWRCHKPGCPAVCWQHGTCNQFEGKCVCQPHWIGPTCQVRLESAAWDGEAFSVCPFTQLSLSFTVPVYPGSAGWFLVTHIDAYKYWAYWESRSNTYPDGRNESAGAYTGALTFPVALFPVPDNYLFTIYLWNNYTEYIVAPFVVRPWSHPACLPPGTGNASSVLCDSDAECGAPEHGACDAATGQCVCRALRFGHDCSRGCGLASGDAVLTGAAGVVTSDEGAQSESDAFYALSDNCSWVIDPAGDADTIRLEFEWLALGMDDSLSVYSGARRLEVFEHTPPPPVRRTYRSGRLRLVLVSDHKTTAAGFRLRYTSSHSPMSASLKVAIVLPTILGVVIVAGAGTYVAKQLADRRRERRLRLLSAPPELLDAREATEADNEALARALLERGITLSKTSLDFGLQSEAFPVLRQMCDTLLVRNCSSRSLAYVVYVPSAPEYFEMSFLPGRGTVRPHHGIALGVSFRLLLTTRVDRRVKIVFTVGGESLPVYVDLALEGAISDRLDPAEITLEPAPLGSGGFGAVYRGIYRGRDIAVKVLRRQAQLEERQLEAFNKEIDLYRRLRCPYIVDFVGASHVRDKLCLCTELMEFGNLETLIFRFHIPDIFKAKVCWDIAEAMNFLHSHNVLYRDLKPSNVLVSSLNLGSKVNCKISDFGTSKNVDRLRDVFSHTVGAGTPIYMAPEMFGGSGYNHKIDQYSYAVTVWQLFSREMPWRTVSCWKIPDLVIKGQRPPIPPKCPLEFAALIGACWAHCPGDRPEFADVCASLHEVFAEQVEANGNQCLTERQSFIDSRALSDAARQAREHSSSSGHNKSKSHAGATVHWAADEGEDASEGVAGFATGDLSSKRTGIPLVVITKVRSPSRPESLDGDVQPAATNLLAV
eukprot:m51a1_g327 putative serine-threonine protein (1044) ;mRNA; f:455802-459694